MGPVLITGVGGPAGRNLATLFRARGISVVGVDMQPLEAPEFTFHQVVAARHPDYLSQLQKLVVLHQVDSLIPTVSEELPFIAANATRLTAKVVIGRLEAVAVAHDKYLTYRQLARCGVNVPKSVLPSDLLGSADQYLGLPYLSKPRVGRGGRGVVLHTDAAAVIGLGDDQLLQSFAPGVEYTVNLYLPEAENVADDVVIVLEKLELRDGQVGNAVRVQRADARDVAATTVKAAKSLGLTGIMDMDVRRAADGTPLVLEVNARTGANICFAPEVFDALCNDLEARSSAHSLSFFI